MVQPLSVVEVKTKGWEITIKEHPDPAIQEKSVTLSENGETTILPDEGFKGLSAVNVTVDVEAGVEIAAEKRIINAPIDLTAGQVLRHYKRIQRKKSPEILPQGYGSYQNVDITSDGEFLVVGNASLDSAPRVILYRRGDDGEYTNVAFDDSVVPLGFSVKFSNDKTFLVVGSNQGAVYVFKRVGDSYEYFVTLNVGTSLAVSRALAFSHDDVYLAAAISATPFMCVFKRNGDTFERLANPAVLPNGQGYSVAFSPDDSLLAVGHATATYLSIYSRNGDTFTKGAAPVAGAQVNGLQFSVDGKCLFLGTAATPYLRVTRMSPSGLYIYEAPGIYAPAPLPVTARGIAVSKNGENVFIAMNAVAMLAVFSVIGGVLRGIPFPITEYTKQGSTASVAISDDGVLVWTPEMSPYLYIAQIIDEYSVDEVSDSIVEGHAIVLTNAQRGEQVEIAYIRG